MHDCKYNIVPKHRRIGFHVEIKHQFLSIFFFLDKCHEYCKSYINSNWIWQNFFFFFGPCTNIQYIWNNKLVKNRNSSDKWNIIHYQNTCTKYFGHVKLRKKYVFLSLKMKFVFINQMLKTEWHLSIIYSQCWKLKKKKHAVLNQNKGR